MKRAIIVHCWSGYPEYCWYPYVKKELEARGFSVLVPALPETDEPKLALWLPTLSSAIGEPDEGLYLIGHSAGCVTIMRYLEGLGQGIRIGGAVFVAGFTDNLGIAELSNFFDNPLDFDKIRESCKKFVCIFSDNDPYVDLKFADVFREKLGAEIIVKSKQGHFSGAADGENSCTELPDVVQAIS